MIILNNEPISFAYHGNNLVYPTPVIQNLLLWYDFKGLTNDSSNKQISKDLNNMYDGKLNNFSYTENNSYDKEGLLFDGIDDFIDVTEFKSSSLTNLKEFSFEFIIRFTDSNKRGAIINMPMSERLDASIRLLIKVNENKSITIGRYNGIWNGYKTIPLNEEKIHCVVLFNEFDTIPEDSGFEVKFIINNKEIEKDSFTSSSEYYGIPYDNLVLGWHGTATLGEYSFLKEKLIMTRIYDRLLTLDEIDYNYKLEKERGNI